MPLNIWLEGRFGHFIDPALRAILETSLTADDNDLFLSNLVDTPVLAIHGCVLCILVTSKRLGEMSFLALALAGVATTMCLLGIHGLSWTFCGHGNRPSMSCA